MARSNLSHNGHTAGFTLIEVLIALVMVAVVLYSAMRALSVSADTHHQLDQKVVAEWVAEDLAARFRALPAVSPDTIMAGKVTQGGVNFVWKGRVEEVSDSPLKRIRLEVWDADESTRLQELAVFVLK